MDTLNHTFPLPDTEAHKLDEIRSQTSSRPRAYIRDRVWAFLALSAVTGGLLGYFLPLRRR